MQCFANGGYPRAALFHRSHRECRGRGYLARRTAQPCVRGHARPCRNGGRASKSFRHTNARLHDLPPEDAVDVIPRRGTRWHAVRTGAWPRDDLAGDRHDQRRQGCTVQRVLAQSRRHGLGGLRPGAIASARAKKAARQRLPIWVHFMREALRGVPQKVRPMPEGLGHPAHLRRRTRPGPDE